MSIILLTEHILLCNCAQAAMLDYRIILTLHLCPVLPLHTLLENPSLTGLGRLRSTQGIPSIMRHD